jgi:cytochrome P450
MFQTTTKTEITVSAPGHKVPPGPRGELVAGCGRQFQRDPLGFLLTIQRQYGDVVRYRLGWWNFYLFSLPDHVKHILVENTHNYGGFLVDRVVASVFGRGLFMSEGEVWRRHRRMMQASFHRERVKTVGPVTAAATLEMLEQWQVLTESGQPLDMLREMMSLALRIAVKELFGIGLSAEAHSVTQAVTDIRDYFGYRIARMPFVPPRFIPTAQNRKFQVALQSLQETVARIINERRRHNEDTGDLLSRLMLARDKETGYRMDDRQIRDEVMAMVFMSHEPTADVLTWTWYLLSQHPMVERRLHEELAEVLGGRTPTVEDLPNLPYTRRVLEEAMRLYPPAWLLGRRALVDDEIGGYHIPKKSIVVFSPYITHRHPALWENPEEFAPDRFTPERSTGRPGYAYIPFGGGPHGCIGSHFAMIECQSVLATVAQHYRPRLVPGHPVEPDPLITLQPRHGMLMTLECR